MVSLDHKTAAFIIPPEGVSGPIQAIRQQHDRKVGRWMPHVTLTYPFLPGHMAGFGAGTIAPPGLVTRWQDLVACWGVLRRLG
jgi:hypothetical protein